MSSPSTGDNLVVRAARVVFDEAGRPFRGLVVDCVNRIPLRRGLGSSAATRLGGILGADALPGEPFDRFHHVLLLFRALRPVLVLEPASTR